MSGIFHHADMALEHELDRCDRDNVRLVPMQSLEETLILPKLLEGTGCTSSLAMASAGGRLLGHARRPAIPALPQPTRKRGQQ